MRLNLKQDVTARHLFHGEPGVLSAKDEAHLALKRANCQLRRRVPRRNRRDVVSAPSAGPGDKDRVSEGIGERRADLGLVQDLRRVTGPSDGLLVLMEV